MKRCPCGIGPDVHEHNGHISLETKIREAELAVIEAAIAYIDAPLSEEVDMLDRRKNWDRALDRLKALKEKAR